MAKVRLELNAWELVAIERGLDLLAKTAEAGSFYQDSIQQLALKVVETRLPNCKGV